MYASNITDLPTLHSYEQALEHYESIKPIRGSNNLRPICNTPNGRRKKHMQIIKRKDAIACRLYETDVLVFHKGSSWETGVIEYHSGTWISNSTHSFASEILHPYIWFSTRQGHTSVCINYRDIGESKSYYISPSQTLKIRRVGEPHHPPEYTAINPPKNMEYYLKRKEYNAKRRPLKEFQDHCIRMAKLADPTERQADISPALHARNAKGWWYYLDMYKDLTLDLHKDAVYGSSSWGRLVPIMLEKARIRHRYTDAYVFDMQIIKDFISDVVKYAFADEVFEEKEVSRKTFNGNETYIWHKYKGEQE